MSQTPLKRKKPNFEIPKHHGHYNPSHLAFMHVWPEENIEPYEVVLATGEFQEIGNDKVPKVISATNASSAVNYSWVGVTDDTPLSKYESGTVIVSGIVSIKVTNDFKSRIGNNNVKPHSFVKLSEVLGVSDDNAKKLIIGTFVRPDTIKIYNEEEVHFVKIMLCTWINNDKKVLEELFFNNLETVLKAADTAHNSDNGMFEDFGSGGEKSLFTYIKKNF